MVVVEPDESTNKLMNIRWCKPVRTNLDKENYADASKRCKHKGANAQVTNKRIGRLPIDVNVSIKVVDGFVFDFAVAILVVLVAADIFHLASTDVVCCRKFNWIDH